MIGDLIIRLSAETSNFVVPVKQARTGLEGIVSNATAAQFQIDTMSKVMAGVSVAASGLSVVSSRLLAISGFAKLAGSGLMMLSTGIGFVGGVAFKTASAIGLLMVPLEGLLIVGRAVLAPFKMLFSIMLMLGRAIITVVKPMISLAFFAFKVKVAIMSLGIQFKLIWKFIGMLSPRLRILVIGLTALGLAGRAGSVAMGLFSRAVKVGTVVVLAFVQPLAALKIVAMSVAMSMARLTFSLVTATRSMARMAATGAVTGIKSLGKAALSVAGIIGTKLVDSLKSALKVTLLIGIAAAGWGIKLFADAEQAEVAFTTMLKSGKAARRVLGELEQFAASTPFQLKSLRDGAKQLLNAQVPTDQLTNKLRMLGDIAAGTGKPILDFTRIFAKVKATGKVSLETLNQLAERGVPIYSSLAEGMGVSRTEMLKMISSGKVGFNDLDKALISMSTGAGVFAGGMAAQSLTISGLFSTLRDNVSFAMRSLGKNVSDAFDFKKILGDGITFFQSLRKTIADSVPIFQAMAEVVHAAFSAIWEIVSVVFTSIASAMGITSGNIIRTIMETLAVFTWVFKSWPDIAELVFLKIGLYAVQMFANIKYFFTVVAPAMLSWFFNNWKSIFYDAGKLVITIFQNLGKNIRAIWTGVMKFLSGKGFSVDFTPLTEGFKKTVRETADIPDRIVGSIERDLVGRVERTTNKLAGSLQSEIEKNMAFIDKFEKVKLEDVGDAMGKMPDKMATQVDIDALSSTEGKPSGIGDGESEATSEQKSAGIMERGSSEAFKSIFGGQNKGQLGEQKKTNKILAEVAKNTGLLIAGEKPMTIAIQGTV